MNEDDVDMSKEVTYEIPNNHILLKFNDDDMAELFFYWWQEEGLLKFVKHYNKVKKNEESI